MLVFFFLQILKAAFCHNFSPLISYNLGDVALSIGHSRRAGDFNYLSIPGFLLLLQGTVWGGWLTSSPFMISASLSAVPLVRHMESRIMIPLKISPLQ